MSVSTNLPYTVLGTILVSAIVIASLVIYPSIQSLSDIHDETAAIQARMTERQAFLQTIDRKRLDLDRNSTHERELDVVLPAQDTTIDLLRIIDRHALAAGIAVAQTSDQSRSVRATARTARQRGDRQSLPADVLPVRITLEGSGTYPQWRQFITALESSVRLIEIPRLSLSLAPNTLDILNAQLTIQAYLVDTGNTPEE